MSHTRRRAALVAVVAAAVAGYALVCLHSVEEIHYLKSFFPSSFSVAEARDAAVVELIKVVIIGLPLALLVGACAALWRGGRSEKETPERGER